MNENVEVNENETCVLLFRLFRWVDPELLGELGDSFLTQRVWWGRWTDLRTGPPRLLFLWVFFRSASVTLSPLFFCCSSFFPFGVLGWCFTSPGSVFMCYSGTCFMTYVEYLFCERNFTPHLPEERSKI